MDRTVIHIVIITVASLVIGGSTGWAQSLNRELQELGIEYFAWRASTQPCGPDDIPRIERTDGWLPEYSASAIDTIRLKYSDFRDRLDNLPKDGWSRADSVDYLLLRSAIERVHWEIDVLRLPYKNPEFYVQQTLGSVYELLFPSTEMNSRRLKEIVRRLNHIPATVRAAEQNLTDPVRPFAEIAIRDLEGARKRLAELVASLKPVCDSQTFEELDRGARIAADSLDAYGEWLREILPSLGEDFGIGSRAYKYFIRNIALIPWAPEEMLQAGRSEFDRAVTFEQIERVRNAALPPSKLFATAREQIEQAKKDEASIRKFLIDRKLLTIPSWIQHYRTRLVPPYVQAFAGVGEMDDLTSASRLNEDGTAYIPPPSPRLSYFRKASAQDPRPITIHEGVPGHYFQLAVSWSHPDPIRRHYFDSGSNEGWAFYAEEMMLQAGLFDRDRPQAREIIYNFMRLRALRVEVDIQLALGEFTIPQAGEYLASRVPMDTGTAMVEAAFFAATPGQAITYQIGKLQIQKFLSDARKVQADQFDLRAFHDYLVRNGNVPIALLRWEYLGLDDEIEKLW
jgi:hypothetical protein